MKINGNEIEHLEVDTHIFWILFIWKMEYKETTTTTKRATNEKKISYAWSGKANSWIACTNKTEEKQKCIYYFIK